MPAFISLQNENFKKWPAKYDVAKLLVRLTNKAQDFDGKGAPIDWNQIERLVDTFIQPYVVFDRERLCLSKNPLTMEVLKQTIGQILRDPGKCPPSKVIVALKDPLSEFEFEFELERTLGEDLTVKVKFSLDWAIVAADEAYVYRPDGTGWKFKGNEPEFCRGFNRLEAKFACFTLYAGE
jgi:hypothetical protein